MIRAGFELRPKQRVEKVIRVMKVIHLLRTIGRHLPLRETLKRPHRALKRVVYARRAKRYRKFINRPFPETKVLVVMNAGIGNAVEATPLVQAIRMLWPRAEITIYPPVGDLFDDWCVVDHVARSADNLNGKSFTHTFVTCSSLVSECGDYCDLGKVHRVVKLLGPQFLKPERQYNLDMIRRLGYKGLTPPLYVSIREPENTFPSSPPQICLIPGSKLLRVWRNKRWPYFGELTEVLLKEHETARVFFLGTREDQVPSGVFRSPRVIDLRDRLTLRETAWVLRHANLAIGNDCGPMHMADAVQTPSIIIFGPTCELKNGPMYKSIVATNAFKCALCQYNGDFLSCENPVCMTELSPDIVLKHADSLLAGIRTQSKS